MSIGSCLIIWLKLIQSGDSYNSVIVCLSISDILCCTSLLTIVIANEVFAYEYLQYEYAWRASFLCYTSSFLSTIANYLSLFTINLLTLSRYFVIKNPLKSRFNESHFLTGICIVASMIISFLSLSVIVSHFYITKSHQLPTGLCLLLGHIRNSLLPYIFTLCTITCQILSCLAIPIIYLLILNEIYQLKVDLGEINSTAGRPQNVTKSILVAFSNLASWVPSSVLLCMTLVWDKYPYSLLIWTTMVIIPSNTVINPYVFVFFKIGRICVMKLTESSNLSRSFSDSMDSKSSRL